MAVMPRRVRFLALVQLAVAVWLATASGCLCRRVIPHCDHVPPPTPALQPPPPPTLMPPPPPAGIAPHPPRHHPICFPFCRSPPICPHCVPSRHVPPPLQQSPPPPASTPPPPRRRHRPFPPWTPWCIGHRCLPRRPPPFCTPAIT